MILPKNKSLPFSLCYTSSLHCLSTPEWLGIHLIYLSVYKLGTQEINVLTIDCMSALSFMILFLPNLICHTCLKKKKKKKALLFQSCHPYIPSKHTSNGSAVSIFHKHADPLFSLLSHPLILKTGWLSFPLVGPLEH